MPDIFAATRGPHVQAQSRDSFTILPGRAGAGVILLCDHAGNALPEGYGTLGLCPTQLDRHIAYDIGAEDVTRRLSKALGAPAILSRYSRLLIDLNRGLDDPTLIMRLSDGAVVPGNRRLSAEDRGTRIRRYYEPYHAAIANLIDCCMASGHPPALLSIHTFTECWRGAPRPWHAGVLWDTDARLAKPLLDGLGADPALVVGDNEPYSGRLEGDTMWRHGIQRGLPHALVEIRQDLVRDEAGQAAWGDRLAELGRYALVKIEGARMKDIDPKTAVEIESAAFRRLLDHLRARPGAQNIDLMNLAGFCRNCLANWYAEAAAARGVTLDKDQAREIVYGMPYAEWRAKHQAAASPEQQAAFGKSGGHEH